MGILSRTLGIDKLTQEIGRLAQKIEGFERKVSELKDTTQQPTIRTNEVSLSHDPLDDRIRRIERFVHFNESIHGSTLLSQASSFMESVPDEIRSLENREVSGIEYTRKRDVLRFSLNMIKIYFETLDRSDLVKQAEILIERSKKL